MPTLNFNVQKARQDGVTDDEIQQYVASEKAKGNTINLQQPEVNRPPEENKVRDMIINSLPVVGAIGGSFIPGLGNIVGGAVGAGAGALAKNLLDDKEGVDAGDVLKETALGGVGGVVGKGLSSVAGKVLPKIGRGIEKTGENVAIRSLRPSKTQLTKYAASHGEDMAKTMTRTGAVGKSAEEMDEIIKPLQNQFNSITKNSGIKISRQQADSKALKYIDELLKSPSKEDHKIAEQLLEEYDFAMKTMGDDLIDISKINDAKITFAGKVNSWKLDPMQAGKNELLGKIFRETTQEAADSAGLTGANGETLKQLGLELNKLYDLKGIAALQGNLGRGNLPIGLSTLLSAGGAGAMGGGLPGAAGTVGVTLLANNPRAMQVYSKLAMKAGKAMQTMPSIPGGQVVSQGIGQTTTRMGGSMPPIDSSLTPDANSNYNPENDTSNQALHNMPTISQGITESNGETTRPDGFIQSADGKILSQDKQWVFNEQTQQWDKNAQEGGGFTKENLRQAYIEALQSGDTKTLARIKEATNYLFPEDKAQKPLSAAARKDYEKANSGLRAVERIEADLVKDPNLLAKKLNPLDQGGRAIGSDITSIIDLIGYFRTGATITPDQRKDYRYMFPSLLDSPDVRQRKLAAIKEELQGYQMIGESTGSIEDTLSELNY